MEIIRDMISFVINFEIPFGTATFKPIYFIYISCAMALLKYLLAKDRSD